MTSPGLSEDRYGKPLQEHLDMMRRPVCWLHFPVLPLKRGDVFGHTPEHPRVGYLLARPGLFSPGQAPEPVVHFWDMYGVLPRPDPAEKRYESLEAILADGWGVD